jgi:citrate lyase gamma subunit
LEKTFQTRFKKSLRKSYGKVIHQTLKKVFEKTKIRKVRKRIRIKKVLQKSFHTGSKTFMKKVIHQKIEKSF